MSLTGRIGEADLPLVTENLKKMTFVEVLIAYRDADISLYPDSVMMLTMNELKRREKVAMSEEVALTFREALKKLNEEIYKSESLDQERQYELFDNALKWLERMTK